MENKEIKQSSVDENIEDFPYELEFRDIDKMILPSFLKLLDEKEIILDLSEESKMSVSYSKKGLKWIKDVKKKDPLWNEEHFLIRILHSALNMSELMDKEENKITEDPDVHKSNETTDSTISN
jgi:hypothetical protein